MSKMSILKPCFSLILSFSFSLSSHALPEASLNTRANGAIKSIIIKNSQDPKALKEILSLTGIPVLDNLWKSAQTIRVGRCDHEQNNCRVMSVFHGQVKNRPIVLLAGFTGYRQMYIEQVYDLMQSGYGPVYVGDFSGSGGSFRAELNPGQRQLTINELLYGNYGLSIKDKKVPALFNARVNQIVGAADSKLVTDVLGSLPLGRGHIKNFDDYVFDISFMMGVAIKQNPNEKIVMTALSSSSLYLLLALAKQKKNSTWVKHVDSIVLLSPMTRTRGTDQQALGFITFGAAQLANMFMSKNMFAPKKSLPEFADKALGNFEPSNVISQSANRLTLTDSLRVWNGFETGGTTFGWATQELSKQYVKSATDYLPFFSDPLNYKLKDISEILASNNITLVTVISDADQLVDPEAATLVSKEIYQHGLKNTFTCKFKTAKHVIDQESDTYREPYMSLVVDMKERRSSTRKAPLSIYGKAPRNELLRCALANQ